MSAPTARWRVLAACIVLSAVSAACAGGQAAGGGGGGGAQPTVRIGVGIDPAYAPFFVADEQGIFDKHGVDAEVVQFAKGGDAIDAIAGGEIQLAGNSEVTTIGMLPRNDLCALMRRCAVPR